MSASLEARDNSFYLKGEKVRILSGAIHYFRVVPEYWQDRLQKLKFCGLNCVETYVPWNLHEEVKDQFKFDGILDLRQFIKIAQCLDLYVIIRPGPYICSEWDFGGLPSWLLSDGGMKIRCSYQAYLDAVEKYFNKLLPLLVDLQYSKGGPIICFQLENEYGSYAADLNYMNYLKKIMLKNGIVELLFTSDNGGGLQGDKLQDVLMTLNLQEKDHGYLMHEYLKNVKQPGKPLMVMELWTGWFDHWGEGHHIVPTEVFEETLNWILDECGSFNLYMFHGGTNFGFMNGANESYTAKEPYLADVTSYDYNAPVTECGELTEKYFVIKKVLKERGLLKIDESINCPTSVAKCSYGTLKIQEYMLLDDALPYVQKIESDHLLMMEELPINNGGGQGYGHILYECHIDNIIHNIKVVGRVKDRAVIILNKKEVSLVDNKWENYCLNVHSDEKDNLLQILVENTGRVNYTYYSDDVMNDQRKGLRSLLVNGEKVKKWTIYPIEFKEDFVETLKTSKSWTKFDESTKPEVPCLFRTSLDLKLGQGHSDNVSAEATGEQQQQQTPQDTFISLQGWTKGNVFINNFNLGRYWNIGPQKTLYIPGPLIKEGSNQILLFELHRGGGEVSFVSENDLGNEEIHKSNVPMTARAQLFMLKNTLKMGSWVWGVMKPFIK